MKLTIRLLLALAPVAALAQGTAADYQRAQEARQKYQGLAINIAGPVTWTDAEHFWYRRSVKGGHDFLLVDAASKNKKPAFDHEKLAAALSSAAGQKYDPLTLPFTTFEFADAGRTMQVAAAGSTWRCQIAAEYSCIKTGAAPAGAGRGAQPPAAADDDPDAAPAEFENDVVDGMVVEPAQYANPQQGGGRGGRGGAGAAQQQDSVRVSPDGNWEALIQNFNVFLRAKGARDAAGASGATPLSLDGSEGNYYTLASITWSPDSKSLVASRVLPGYRREVHYVE